MDKNLIEAQDVFLSKANQICNKFGLNNIMAQLYAILYLSNKAMSLNELAERLKISKGNASINIRALERYGAVKKVWVKGSRKDYYEAEMNISKVIIDRVKSMAQARLSEVEDMVSASSDALNSVNSRGQEEEEAVKIYKQRLREIKGLQNKALYLFKLFNSGLLGNMLNTENNSAEMEEPSVLR